MSKRKRSDEQRKPELTVSGTGISSTKAPNIAFYTYFKDNEETYKGGERVLRKQWRD